MKSGSPKLRVRLPGATNGFPDREKKALRRLAAHEKEERKMKKRDLHAEIAEGFVALSRLRKGKITSSNVLGTGADLVKTPTGTWESEDLTGNFDASADKEIVGRIFWAVNSR